jgi:hypothetical protein
MKRKMSVLIAIITILVVVLACSSPYRIAVLPANSPTPDGTMTAIFALATLLTPEKATVTSTVTPPPTATTTSTATSTVAPTETSTTTSTSIPYVPPVYVAPSASRAGGAYYADHFTPDVDGNWGEWGSNVYNAGAIVYGSGNWTGEKDLDAAFRVAWNSSNLYIATKVIDDTYAQNASGGDLYKGDSVEILFDEDLYGDGWSSVLDSDDYQLVLSPGKGDVHGSREAVLYFPRSRSGTKTSVKIRADYYPDSPSGSNHYVLEAAIPWSVLGVSGPYSGATYGFLLSVSDNDDTSDNVQQTMSSSSSGRRLTNPTTWGTLILN